MNPVASWVVVGGLVSAEQFSSAVVEMEPSKKRKTSHMWEYYEMTGHNKVKCLLCDRVLVYNNNTSSMIRHYRAMHENKHTSDTGDTSQSSRKQVLDEAVANLIVKDSQPFSVVEDEGFRELIHLLDPTYVLPTRKALKKMVEDKFYKTKEKAKEDIQKSKQSTRGGKAAESRMFYTDCKQ
ncbi:zinc finger BED domain-containing protein 4-like isoform 1-T1 [Menidia menidia]